MKNPLCPIPSHQTLPHVTDPKKWIKVNTQLPAAPTGLLERPQQQPAFHLTPPNYSSPGGLISLCRHSQAYPRIHGIANCFGHCQIVSSKPTSQWHPSRTLAWQGRRPTRAGVNKGMLVQALQCLMDFQKPRNLRDSMKANSLYRNGTPKSNS